MPEEKGRFCGSCQKTVIDFTTMSDRQIAAFFKKPTGLTCGRFHQDQLNREIEIPKKRIPWVKYFFTVAIPAFFASCKFAGRQDIVGKMKITEVTQTQLMGDTTAVDMPPPPPVFGNVRMPEFAKDSLAVMGKPALPKETVEGKVETVRIPPTHCVTEPPQPNSVEDTAIKEGLPLDTVTITGYRSCQRSVIMGGLSIIKTGVVKKQAVPLTETPKQTIEAVAYPNPVKAGGQLTVLLKTSDDKPKQIGLFSSSGASVKWQQSDSFKGNNVTLTLPSALPAGTYFVRILSGENQSSTVKITVLN